MNNFTKGLLTGTIIGATIGMAMRENRNMRLQKKTMKNGRKFIRTASSVLENIFDM